MNRALGLLDAAHFHTYNVQMIKFEWGSVKAASNLKKHGVSFGEAQSVFYDEFALQFFDAENSATEDRFFMLGMSGEAKLLLVCHCERDGGDTIRIISARKATSNECMHYHGGLS
ncbi:BrnT family toxin [Marinobacter gelidimuriae]|uniref:BrnT family toxin n=1 Tax=Marinobacter gelidimuriae TaxID=2739064 RepID=UPI001E5CDA6D|nr:BrnT family toxin [Marinobacter gelidimuriae]